MLLVLKMEGEKKTSKNPENFFLQLKVEYEGNYIDYNCDMSWAWLMPVNVFVSVF